MAEREVIEGRTISFSQAWNWDQCARRWGYQYLEGRPIVPNEYMVYGNKVHSEIEDYLLDHVDPEDRDPETLGYKGWDYVEGLEPDLLFVEEHVMDKHSQLPVIVHGYIDVLVKHADGRNTLIDWKTKKRKPKVLDERVAMQLSLYGQLANFVEGDMLLAVYPEYDMTFELPYTDALGNRARDWIENVALEIEAACFKGPVSVATELSASPTKLCDWCDFENECPSSYSKLLKEFRN